MFDKKDPSLKPKISNFGICENLMVEVCLGILNEYIQRLFAIYQQISLSSVFRENGRLTARNPFLNKIYLIMSDSVTCLNLIALSISVMIFRRHV